MFEKLKAYVLARLAEKSTMAGLAGLIISGLAAAGVIVPEGVSQPLVDLLSSLGALISTILVGINTTQKA